MKRTILALLVAGLILPACAGTRSGEEGATQRASRDVLLAAEIQERGAQIQTALDAVQQLRPHFLRERANPTMGVGAATVEPVVVYVNGIRRGTGQELARIRAEQVESIRYIRPTDAQTRFGMGHGSGALEVTLHGGS